MRLYSHVRKLEKLTRLVGVKRYRAALRYRVAAAVEHTAALRGLRLNTIIDIGANTGQFALVARQCHPEARVFAFEPLASAADVFATVFRNDPRVALHRVAIGPDAGVASMNVSARPDSSSLLPITELQERVFAGTHHAGKETVRVARLTECLSREALVAPVLLKLDVQGFELAALHGCSDLLDAVDHLYVEASFVELYAAQALVDDIIRFVQAQAFGLRGVYNMVEVQGRPIQADFLFSRVVR
jgi:FkbM family methyltransferase